jgi:uncharacterized hydrophobic protein (TIGR00271 family)
MEPSNKRYSSLVESFKAFVGGIFDIYHDTDKLATIEDVKAGTFVKGQTAWVLIFSILIASVGLNTSSTAVVIGAMLISPLMGPILGMGLSLGINDIDFLKRAIKNFAVMVVLSLVTSFLFFSIPMFQNETPELIARTFPDVRDVIIALCGGLALIVALSRRNKSINTIAGVAIATALMPPLCTAGYGLATAKWNFFGGAMFLFSINTIFIATATFAVVRFLKFPYEAYADSKQRRSISQLISALAIIILVPSIYMFYELYQKSKFEQRVDRLMEDVRTSRGILILDVKKDFVNKKVSFAIIGKSIDKNDVQEFNTKMRKMGYDNIQFEVLQDVDNLETISKIEEIKNSYLSTQQLLVQKEEKLLSKDREIFELKNQMNKSKETQFQFEKIAKEVKINYENVVEVAYSKMIKTDFNSVDTIPVIYLKWNEKTAKSQIAKDEAKIKQWMLAKLEIEKLQINKLE